MITNENKTTYTIDEVNAKFLKMLPLITMIAKRAFLDYNSDKRDDAIQSVIVAAFLSCKSLADRGLLHKAFATPLAWYAIRQYRDGRIGGVPMNSEDVMSERCQLLGRADVRGVVYYQTRANIRHEILIFDDRTPDPLLDAQCNIDYENWRNTLTEKDREMLDAFLAGDTTREVAIKFNMSDGRISQMRRILVKSYQSYVGD